VARDRYQELEYGRSIRRVLIGVLVFVLLVVFLLWRIDNPRVERFRNALVDQVIPSMDWALVPVAGAARMIGDFQSYANIYEQNQELRRDLQRLKGWREAAIQLEQENAKLLDLNKVRIDPKLTFITGVVLTDSGSPFRQSALINVGRSDGIIEGWATMDGLGLVGRIAGVGESTSRVILLTDSNSRIPVKILPSGQKAIMSGVNSLYPAIDFLENPGLVHPGDRVVSAGDGGVFPPDLLVGQLIMANNRRILVQLAADYQRLEFLRILRSSRPEMIGDTNIIIGNPTLPPTVLVPTGGDGSDG
jgi:rod shape-determining protein MreC